MRLHSVAKQYSKSVGADEKVVTNLPPSVRNGVFIRCHIGVARNVKLAAAAGLLQPVYATLNVQAGFELAQEAGAVYRAGFRCGCQPVLGSCVCGSERSVISAWLSCPCIHLPCRADSS